MSGVATAVIASTVISGIVASKSAKAAGKASKTAASAEERVAAENRALNEDRMRSARTLMNPYIDSAGQARRQIESELYSSGYVPGRDDLRQLGQDTQGTGGRVTGRNGRNISGGGIININPINPATGQTWTASDEASGAGAYTKKLVLDAVKQADATGKTGAEHDQLMQGYLQRDAEHEGRMLGMAGTQNVGDVSQYFDYQQSGQQAGQQQEYIPAGTPYQDAVRDVGSIAPGGAYLNTEQTDYSARAPGGQLYRDPVTGEQMASDFGELAPGGNLYRDPSEMMQENFIDPSQYFGDMGSGFESFKAGSPYQGAIDAGVRAVESSNLSQGMGRSGTAMLGMRDVGQGVESQYFSNYLNELGRVTGINENRRSSARDINESRMNRDFGSEEQRYANYLNIGENRRGDVNAANESRFANYLNLDEQQRRDTQNINEGRFANYANFGEQRRMEGEQQRINDQNTSEQRYTNYMNMLQGMADPSTATNLASMGVNQGIQQGQQQARSVANQNQYMMSGVAAQNAARADMAGGITNLASAYIGSQGGNTPPPASYSGSTGGTINMGSMDFRGGVTPNYNFGP